jgi:PhnB protein
VSSLTTNVGTEFEHEKSSTTKRRETMQMNVHLNFQGNCGEAFEFYKQVFGDSNAFTMKYGDAPGGSPVPPDWNDKVMHTSIKLGDGLLMGCDAPQGLSTPIGGFQISVESKDEGEVKRIYEALKEGGSVQMPLAPTFWSPMFGMCTDRFGVAWMVAMLGPSEV